MSVLKSPCGFFVCALAVWGLMATALLRGQSIGESQMTVAIPPGSRVSPTNAAFLGKPGFTVVTEKDSMEMVFVPAGPFCYGEDETELDLPAFYIDKHEVTNAQFARFVSETGHRPGRWRMKRGMDDYPAVYVSLEDCSAYAGWVGKTLPTDEQWEKAARGADGRLYPWGTEWCDANAVTPEGDYDGPMPVGSVPGGASPYGALDMVGNVWEWTQSFYDNDHHRVSLRGGAWDAHKGKKRSNCIYKSKASPECTDGKLGFRCVWVAQE